MPVASSIQKVMAPLNEALEENSTLGAQVQTEGGVSRASIEFFLLKFPVKG